MHAQRPCTAPCRRPTSEDWTQVDAVVRDMFSTVASTATSSSSALPRRPHTACVCAQLVQKKAQSSDDDESDGASIDVDSDDDVKETTVRRSTALSMTGLTWLQEQRELNGASRTSTALVATSHPNESEGHIEVKSSLASRRSCQSPELPREKALLLGGQLWGKATSSSSLAAPTTPKNEISHTKVAVTPAVRDVAAKATAKKLPKECLFMGFNSPSQMLSSGQKATTKPRRGLAPAAAKLRSHVSWAHHLPIRTPQHLTNSSSSAATTTSEPSHGIRPEQTADSNVTVESAKDNVTVSEPVSNVRTDFVAAVEAPTDEPPSRKRGPRYYFAPGSSRPVRAPQHAPKRDVMVLEFRTEPRVVPASRAPPKHSERRSEAFRFRPKSREWAAEREVIAMH